MKNKTYMFLIVAFSLLFVMQGVIAAYQPITRVSVYPAVYNLSQGASIRLEAIPSPSQPYVINSWFSSNPAVASVSPSSDFVAGTSGIVTGISPGTAIIFVTTSSGIHSVTGNATINVFVPTVPLVLTNVTVSPQSANPASNWFATGSNPQFTARASDQFNVTFSGASYSWASSNISVATIDSATGIASILSPGVSTITVTATSGVYSVVGKLDIHVISSTLPASPSSLTRIDVSPVLSTLTAGASQTLTATLFDQNSNPNIFFATPVTWSSSNPLIANISSTSGHTVIISAISAGQAVITATATDGTSTISNFSTINSAAPSAPSVLTSALISNLSSITFGSNLVIAGFSEQLYLNLFDQFNVPFTGTTNVVWTSNDTSVATISPSGVLTGISPGEVLIAVSVTDGLSTVTGNLPVRISQNLGFNMRTITSSAGAHGNISPNGNYLVSVGDSRNYVIVPDSGFRIADVLVDGVSVGNVTSYPFVNVNSDHSISVSFASICQTTSDTNSDGIISMSEILAFVNQWKTGTVASADVLRAISFWKLGVGC